MGVTSHITPIITRLMKMVFYVDKQQKHVSNRATKVYLQWRLL